MSFARYDLTEVCRVLQVGEDFVLLCVSASWVVPAEPQKRLFDEEDLARLRLIRELREEMGVNPEAVPIILHLVDQLLAIQSRVRELVQRAA